MVKKGMAIDFYDFDSLGVGRTRGWVGGEDLRLGFTFAFEKQ